MREVRMPDANDWKSEMDITYREIQEINDQLPDLEEREESVWREIERRHRAANEASRERNYALEDEIKSGSRGFSYEHSELQSKIKDLKAQKQALWGKHNEAKAKWRGLRGQ